MVGITSAVLLIYYFGYKDSNKRAKKSKACFVFSLRAQKIFEVSRRCLSRNVGKLLL